jgi:hypothetical protein
MALVRKRTIPLYIRHYTLEYMFNTRIKILTCSYEIYEQMQLQELFQLNFTLKSDFSMPSPPSRPGTPLNSPGSMCYSLGTIDINRITTHRGGPGSSPGLVMWDLWWAMWRWGKFSPSTSVSPSNLHSTNFSTITIIYHGGRSTK